MNLLAPAALGLAALAIPIVAMYILKMRRPARVIPSTFLWEQALHDVQANAPWQRLRRNLLLLLQLLALAALVLALARPYVLRAASTPGDVVAVIDASYLMSATDEAPSRFDAAKARVSALIDGLASDKVMSIVLMARRPRVLIAQSGDHGALHAALDRAAASYDTPDVAAGLSVGEALARSGRQASLFVYTARGDPDIVVPGNLPFKVGKVVLGKDLRDLGIVAFAASHVADGSVTTLTRVSNLGQHAVTSDLQLDVATGRPDNLSWTPLADLRSVTLTPGASKVFVRQQLPSDVVAVRARLTGGDELAADDQAWAVVPQDPTRRVLLVTPGGDTVPVVLSNALSVIPGVRLDTVTPDAYTPARARCADVAVFEGPSLLRYALPGTATPVLAVGLDSSASARLGLIIHKPTGAGTVQEGDDPLSKLLLSATGAHEVAFNQVIPLDVPAWGYAVLRSNGQPFVIAGQNGARREAVLGFQTANTEWGLKVGFPILIDNLLAYLAPAGNDLAGTYRPGDAVTLPTSSCATSVAVVTPGNRRVTLPPPYPAQPFLETGLPGLYDVAQHTPSEARQALFAVNLFPLPPDTRKSVPGGGSAAPSTTTAKAQVPLELAPLVALLALGVLAGEWWVAARRR